MHRREDASGRWRCTALWKSQRPPEGSIRERAPRSPARYTRQPGGLARFVPSCAESTRSALCRCPDRGYSREGAAARGVPGEQTKAGLRQMTRPVREISGLGDRAVGEICVGTNPTQLRRCPGRAGAVGLFACPTMRSMPVAPGIMRDLTAKPLTTAPPRALTPEPGPPVVGSGLRPRGAAPARR